MWSTAALRGTPSPISVSREYMANGNVLALIDGEGNRTQYGYDGFNRQTHIYFPNASGTGTNMNDFEAYSYDSYGRMNGRTLRDGTNITTVYDTMGRPESSGLASLMDT